MIQTRKCPNGVRIVTEQMPHVRSVAIGIWVMAGARNETAGEAGMAHFIEHMLFKGTSVRTAKDIAEAIDRTGGEINAYTAMEETCFYVNVLTEDAAEAVDVLADMFFNSAFDEQEMRKEKSVILEEIAMVADTPDDDVHEQLQAAMYPGHPMGRPILGYPETVSAFTREETLSFMQREYRPERVVISAAGCVDDQLIRQLEKSFGTFTAGAESAIQSERPEFTPGAVRKRKDTEQAHLCLGYPGMDVNDPDIYGMIILNALFGGSMSSRLFQRIREERGLAYSVYSYHSSHTDSGSVTIYAGTSPSRLEETRTVIRNEVSRLLQDGVSDAEIGSAVGQMKGSLLLGLETPASRMSRNAKNELFTGEHKDIDEVMEEFRRVDGRQIRRIAERIFSGTPAESIIIPN
ncbi:Protease 3 precursor [Bhargavaea cecembensis DSE10]|uniref:Protease 3 n=1 Tax=Bhargavaea cecembensis DSE10 TaxID=1235279 RepID=M7P0R2_9BACL|nr:pitrilysin family protein [Bhargavaea cecembensis]EMR07505.1 Protease 3 precursor [Bhargavaea cecembensis DSE10]